MSKINPKDLDAVLPQTQCGECGYPGCLPYAEALADGQATIDCCPPGGLDTLNALGKLLCIDPEPYLKKVKQGRCLALANRREDNNQDSILLI